MGRLRDLLEFLGLVSDGSYESFAEDVQTYYPGAAVEEVGDRAELVIYTGLRVDPVDGRVRRLSDEEVLDG